MNPMGPTRRGALTTGLFGILGSAKLADESLSEAVVGCLPQRDPEEPPRMLLALREKAPCPTACDDESRFEEQRRGVRHMPGLLIALTIFAASACTSPPAKDNPRSSATDVGRATDDSGVTNNNGRAAGVCGKTRLGPTAAPASAVSVDPSVVGDLSAKTEAYPPGTTFWLAAGTHQLGNGEFAQVEPKAGDTYLGAPGAVLDGGGVNRYAFTGKASEVTIKHLYIKRFASPAQEGVVNHDSGDDWVIEGNTIVDNHGAALMAGDRQVVRGNCLKHNGQYGLNACCGSIVDVQVIGNEFIGNHTDDLESKFPGCGCTGAMKFWEINGADIQSNWIHDNHGPGIWADTNNNDFLIERNLIESNDGSAVVYEASYNAIIRDNVLRRNNLVEGKAFADQGDNFPQATIYLSESGGDPRLPARTDRIDIYRNVLENNWSGITLWENADRFCNSPANSSTELCTLLVDKVSRCSQPAIASEPLLGDCRWKTQRVAIHDNRFSVDPEAMDCESLCARMAILANYGTVPEWSPYKGEVIREAITFNQENRWYDNTYIGPWTFMPYKTDSEIGATKWQAAPYRQDPGSTFASSGEASATASTPSEGP
jgi:Right handed beta helix region